MLVFSAICPHPPLLIPEIGKENLKQVQKTQKAMKKLEEIFYARKVDSVVIISPHQDLIPDAFAINLAEKFEVDFKEFGDFSTRLSFKSNTSFAHRLKEALEDHRFPAVLINKNKLDHGCGLPLYYLTSHYENLPITPISFSLMDLKTHYDFGKIISNEIHHTNERIAVIASGDLSHRLTENAPAGFSPKGKEFDKKLIEHLQKKETDKILKMDPELIEEAGECGLRSIIIMLGILNRKKYNVDIFSYEGPFGVGYLVANFSLQ